VPRYALSALGVDRPGIVAAVSGALVELGCNLEDSTMTILQGHFAILLVVSAGAGVSADALEQSLDPVARRFELVTSVRGIGDSDAAAQSSPGGEPWTIAVHGADRTGIVHGMCSALAEAGGNVVDLATHLVGTPDAPVYVMTLRVTLPAGRAGEQAAERVRAAAEDLGVHCTVHPDDADTL
jgi:glycine cleavage system transcriptional repressor